MGIETGQANILTPNLLLPIKGQAIGKVDRKAD
jgi:hypothetical protein